MRHRPILLIALAGLAAAAAFSLTGCLKEEGPTLPPELDLELVAQGLQAPVYLTSPVGDPRLFIVEQAGRIRIVKDGVLLPTPFLDIDPKVMSGGEQGLLGLAFHPDYATNGRFYVDYTNNSGHTRIERYQVSAGNPDVADPASADSVLGFDQPAGNHNGGQLLFGPDGFLYIPTGDGGFGGDPGNRAQNPDSLLGKLLRLDVDNGDPYAIPPDNPYVGTGMGREEIWAIGLRNPWRSAFDRTTGRLYIADVGQGDFEEVNVQPANVPGLNYGWNIMEGAACYPPGTPCDPTGLVLPAVAYAHYGPTCNSVTGGYVYRGSAQLEFVGHYFYSDYCHSFIRSFRFVNGVATDERIWIESSTDGVASFGEDAFGELYVLTGSGRVYHLRELQGP